MVIEFILSVSQPMHEQAAEKFKINKLVFLLCFSVALLNVLFSDMLSCDYKQ